MKKRNLFALAMVTMAFAACSNDDEPSMGGGNGGTQGEIIEAITVAFTNPTSTYARKGTVAGKKSENDVYTAYIFARETNPAHAGALQGDWTVEEVTNKTNPGDAIVEGDGSVAGTRKNMVTFRGVRQGDNVYVIANDESLTKAIAEGLAHRGDESEAAIKSYIASLSKSYLDGLTIKNDDDQEGKFIMAGKATIPTNPTIANGSTVKVPVELERELAKVSFSATVSNNPDDDACGKVQLNEGDGIIVVRIPRQVSFFADQARDWYFPLSAKGAEKDWGFTGEADSWEVAFDGDANYKPANAADASNSAFNQTSKDGAKEYRFTWDTSNADITSTKLGTSEASIASPYFYVTPNYSNHTGCATVIVTQATYLGNTTLKDVVTKEMLTAALNDANFTGTSGINASEITATTWNTPANVAALHTFLSGSDAYKDIFNSTDYPDGPSLVDKFQNSKLYYRADVANYQDDEATSEKVTERNTFYQIQGTITSLGANSIEDAINTDNISMLVKVSVKDWNVVVNRVNM